MFLLPDSKNLSTDPRKITYFEESPYQKHVCLLLFNSMDNQDFIMPTNS